MKKPDYENATAEQLARALLQQKKRRARETDDGDPLSTREESEHVETRAAEPQAPVSRRDRSRKS